MTVKIKYIFGCKHDNPSILSTTIFERGLELPAIFCNDCITICNICLKKEKTKTFDKLELCEKCYLNVIKMVKH